MKFVCVIDYKSNSDIWVIEKYFCPGARLTLHVGICLGSDF